MYEHSIVHFPEQLIHILLLQEFVHPGVLNLRKISKVKVDNN